MSTKERENVPQRAIKCSYFATVFEAIFYFCLVFFLVLSIVTAIRSFVESGKTVTNFQLKKVEAHINPCFMFFGIGFELNVCKNIQLQPGATEFVEMLQEAKPCVSKTFHLVFNESVIERWEEYKLEFPDLSDLITTIDKVIKKRSAGGNNSSLTMTFIVVRGPSIWVEQDAIYMKVTSPKSSTLHPYYTLGDFNATQSRLNECEKKAEEGQPLEAMQLLQNTVREENAVFRYLPTESMLLASMFKENFLREGKLYHTRITLEQTTSTSVYDEDDFQCEDWYHNSGDANATYDSYYDVYEGLYEGWTDSYMSFEETMRMMCGDIHANKTYSESVFRWFDGLVRESNTYDPFDPWTIFGTLTTVVLAVDRMYTTINRYKNAYLDQKRRKIDARNKVEPEQKDVDSKYINATNPKLS